MITRSIFLLLLLLPLGARAQANDAAQAFEAGRTAFADDDYELALSHFRRAYELLPHDNVRFNIAVCLERLGRFREALEEYERAAASTQLDAAARARAREMAERVQPRLATLRITGQPAGARAEIGGRQCDLPCSLALDPGNYELRVHGARDITRQVELTRGQTSSVEVDATANAPAAPETDPRAAAVSTSPSTVGHEPLVLATIGAIVAAIGGAGIIGFGLWTERLAGRYYDDATPPERLPGIYEDGNLARDLTNASIAVAALGGVLLAIDLIWWMADPPRRVDRPLALRF